VSALFHGEKASLIGHALGNASESPPCCSSWWRFFVDLKPAVDENFFFSTSDPGVRESKAVEQRFPSQPQLILAVSSRIFLPRDTSVEFNASPSNLKRSMKWVRSKA